VPPLDGGEKSREAVLIREARRVVQFGWAGSEILDEGDPTGVTAAVYEDGSTIGIDRLRTTSAPDRPISHVTTMPD
jgi:hypothetical protein